MLPVFCILGNQYTSYLKDQTYEGKSLEQGCLLPWAMGKGNMLSYYQIDDNEELNTYLFIL